MMVNSILMMMVKKKMFRKWVRYLSLSLFREKNSFIFFNLDDNEDEDKAAADDLSAVGKLLKNEAINKGKDKFKMNLTHKQDIILEIESSSDDDDLDDSDDPDKESIASIAVNKFSTSNIYFFLCI